jgi:hypothetical protein
MRRLTECIHKLRVTFANGDGLSRWYFRELPAVEASLSVQLPDVWNTRHLHTFVCHQSSYTPG